MKKNHQCFFLSTIFCYAGPKKISTFITLPITIAIVRNKLVSTNKKYYYTVNQTNRIRIFSKRKFEH